MKVHERQSTVASLALLFLLVFFPFGVTAANDGLYEKILSGTAWVITDTGTGTAWVLDERDRLLVTNFHVVAMPPDKPGAPTTPGEKWRAREEVSVVFPVRISGTVISERAFYTENLDRLAVKARVVESDVYLDLVLLQVEKLPRNARALRLVDDFEETKPGDKVCTVGNPGASGALWVYSTGAVRARYERRFRTEVGIHEFKVLETQSPLNRGDSGGPVTNDRGEVVGVVQSGVMHAQLMNQCVDAIHVASLWMRHSKSATPNTAADYYNRAASHYDQGKWDLAISELDESIRLDSTDADAYCLRGQAYLSKGEYAQAIRDISKAISLDSTNGLYFSARAEARQWQEDYAAALSDWNRAEMLGFKEGLLYFGRGSCHNQLKQWNLAIAEFTQAIRMDPSYSTAYFRRGWAYLSRGWGYHYQNPPQARSDYKRSIADYQMVIRLNKFDEEVEWARKKIEACEQNLRSL